jgi:glycosyltransferase involved in cell wall biosynthesis
MFEKLGASLAAIPNTTVHIIGFPAGDSPAKHDSIQLHRNAEKPFGRISATRLTAPFRIMRKVLLLKPHLLIITTHELLWMALGCKLILGCKIIYDVQENYYLNIRSTKTFPAVIRVLLAMYVRLKERICAPFVDHFLMAEKGYNEEIRFARPHLVLENKLPERLANQYRRIPEQGKINLVFSGTLAETTGVLEAIHLAGKLHAVNPDVTLTIIGNCFSAKFLEKLTREAARHSFVHLTATAFPVAHELILASLSRARAGIIIYPPNPSTRSSIPTKLYEYLAIGLPVLIHHNEASHQLVSSLSAGIVLDPEPSPKNLVAQLEQLPGYVPPPEIYWESTEKVLHGLVFKILP